MKSRSLIIALIVLLFVNSSCSQQPENYSFFKLYIKNDKNQILLVKWDNEWEIPGRKYKRSSSIKEFTNSMAKSYGISVSNLKLNALVTFHYSTKSNPTLMHYYSADYSSGKIKTPFGSSNIKWFSIEEAYTIIPYSEMKEIIKHIEKEPSNQIHFLFVK